MAEHGIGHCPWCGLEDASNAGDYYHEKDCHRRDVLRRIEKANKGTYNSAHMAALERELAEASYTGD